VAKVRGCFGRKILLPQNRRCLARPGHPGQAKEWHDDMVP
jgi:hypothetical protein